MKKLVLVLFLSIFLGQELFAYSDFCEDFRQNKMSLEDIPNLPITYYLNNLKDPEKILKTKYQIYLDKNCVDTEILKKKLVKITDLKQRNLILQEIKTKEEEKISLKNSLQKKIKNLKQKDKQTLSKEDLFSVFESLVLAKSDLDLKYEKYFFDLPKNNYDFSENILFDLENLETNVLSQKNIILQDLEKLNQTYNKKFSGFLDFSFSKFKNKNSNLLSNNLKNNLSSDFKSLLSYNQNVLNKILNKNLKINSLIKLKQLLVFNDLLLKNLNKEGGVSINKQGKIILKDFLKDLDPILKNILKLISSAEYNLLDLFQNESLKIKAQTFISKKNYEDLLSLIKQNKIKQEKKIKQFFQLKSNIFKTKKQDFYYLDVSYLNEEEQRYFLSLYSFYDFYLDYLIYLLKNQYANSKLEFLQSLFEKTMLYQKKLEKENLNLYQKKRQYFFLLSNFDHFNLLNKKFFNLKTNTKNFVWQKENLINNIDFPYKKIKKKDNFIKYYHQTESKYLAKNINTNKYYLVDYEKRGEKEIVLYINDGKLISFFEYDKFNRLQKSFLLEAKKVYLNNEFVKPSFYQVDEDGDKIILQTKEYFYLPDNSNRLKKIVFTNNEISKSSAKTFEFLYLDELVKDKNKPVNKYLQVLKLRFYQYFFYLFDYNTALNKLLSEQVVSIKTYNQNQKLIRRLNFYYDYYLNNLFVEEKDFFTNKSKYYKNFTKNRLDFEDYEPVYDIAKTTKLNPQYNLLAFVNTNGQFMPDIHNFDYFKLNKTHIFNFYIPLKEDISLNNFLIPKEKVLKYESFNFDLDFAVGSYSYSGRLNTTSMGHSFIVSNNKTYYYSLGDNEETGVEKDNLKKELKLMVKEKKHKVLLFVLDSNYMKNFDNLLKNEGVYSVFGNNCSDFVVSVLNQLKIIKGNTSAFPFCKEGHCNTPKSLEIYLLSMYFKKSPLIKDIIYLIP
jgi:hypothetical protein